ncbi:MAG TPA: transcription elongation factor GreA [Peptococcaceae bacterium]|nr:transcription elongation factor GreA [Peptococcaceae bacterium]
MAEKQIILTPAGLKKLEEELNYLRTVKRREIADRIKQAIEFGDISENSEYDEAKKEQAFIEGRILTLEKQLRNAEVIDLDQVRTDEVSLGSKVVLEDMELGEIVEYEIVGSMEANPSENRISNESPVGKAILGKKVGSVVDVQVPEGVIKYKILGIQK